MLVVGFARLWSLIRLYLLEVFAKRRCWIKFINQIFNFITFWVVMYRTYIMKLWLATMVVAPIVLFALILTIDPDILALYPIVKLLVFVIFVGSVHSIPTLLCVNLLSNLLERNIKHTKNLKAATILISVIGVVITFSLLSDPDSLDRKEFNWGLTLTLLYSLFIVIFGAIFKIRLD